MLHDVFGNALEHIVMQPSECGEMCSLLSKPDDDLVCVRVNVSHKWHLRSSFARIALLNAHRINLDRLVYIVLSEPDHEVEESAGDKQGVAITYGLPSLNFRGCLIVRYYTFAQPLPHVQDKASCGGQCSSGKVVSE